MSSFSYRRWHGRGEDLQQKAGGSGFGISYEEPSPNSFSFNSPYGTCPECKGLGEVFQVNYDDKVIPDDSKSINEEGIRPFGRWGQYHLRPAETLPKFKFTFAHRSKTFPKGIGTHPVWGESTGKKSYQYVIHDFVYDLGTEGLFNMLKRWYEDTSSERIRAWAEEFMEIAKCSGCGVIACARSRCTLSSMRNTSVSWHRWTLLPLYEWIGTLEKSFPKTMGHWPGGHQRN